MGLLLFALEAQSAGMRVVVLGADTPLEDTAIAQRRSGSDAIVISSSIDPAPELFDRTLPKLTGELGVPVFVGGGTAVRHRRAVVSAGAIPLGIELEDGVRLIAATLKSRVTR
jgi:methylmalonyl-CoA mutase cobalamin-binding subunit